MNALIYRDNMNKSAYLLLWINASIVAASPVCADDNSSAALGSGAQGNSAPSSSNPASASQTTLPRIVVTGTQAPDNNYRVDKVDSIGPLGTTDIQNTPYSIAVLPLDLIENSQAVNFKDVSKYLPLVEYQEQQGPNILRPQTRGIQGGNFQNSKIDGMTMYITVATALEQFQQIEVVNGLSASLYGPANPSGMFNFVSKRPTQNDLHEVSVTYNSNSIGTAHIDFGGPIDKNGVVSYRLNALYGAGDGWVDESHERRATTPITISPIRATRAGSLTARKFSCLRLPTRRRSDTARAIWARTCTPKLRLRASSMISIRIGIWWWAD